jgi:hypothetical protein
MQIFVDYTDLSWNYYYSLPPGSSQGLLERELLNLHGTDPGVVK